MLILVVGPSGAGKDTLLRSARDAFRQDLRFVFPKREITRDAALGGEDFVAIDEVTFAARQEAGAYAFSWRAHNLCYGVPRNIDDDLRAGCTVVVNVSRSILEAARFRYAPMRTVLVTAPAAVLEARLRARAREDASDVATRLVRANLAIQGPEVIHFPNDRPLAQTTAAFVELLRHMVDGAPEEKITP